MPEQSSQCDHCKTWGRTVSLEAAIITMPCPVCRRLTWPNLGVNCPAGCAVALSTGRCIRALQILMRRQQLEDNEVVPDVVVFHPSLDAE